MEQELGHSLFIRRKGYRNAQLTDQGAEFYRIAWNKDFKSWHSENFDETIPPLVILEHAALAAYFMTEKSWTFCPYTTAIRLQKNGACIYELKNSPPEQVVYYLVNENRKTATIHKFLELLTVNSKHFRKIRLLLFSVKTNIKEKPCIILRAVV